MQCDKCGNTRVQAVKRFRMSGCLVSAGFALVVASLIAVAVGVLLVVVGPQATREATTKQDARAQSAAITALEGIPGLPDALLQELESTGKLSEETIGRLPPEQQSRVRTIMIDYYGSRVASGAGGAISAGLGLFLILVLLAFGIPGAIVGLLLIRRTKLWRCEGCGFAFDRT